jgi:DNA invertase Pin-like site-specific DNA recombinase
VEDGPLRPPRYGRHRQRAMDEFDRRRARLYVLQENLDSRQQGTRIVFAILAERAREEIKDLALRVMTSDLVPGRGSTTGVA